MAQCAFAKEWGLRHPVLAAHWQSWEPTLVINPGIIWLTLTSSHATTAPLMWLSKPKDVQKQAAKSKMRSYNLAEICKAYFPSDHFCSEQNLWQIESGKEKTNGCSILSKLLQTMDIQSILRMSNQSLVPTVLARDLLSMWLIFCLKKQNPEPEFKSGAYF